jgi:hypothetical protein
MSGPRVSFAGKIVGVPEPVTKPVVPAAAVQDDGSIFVSIASYRGTVPDRSTFMRRPCLASHTYSASLLYTPRR